LVESETDGELKIAPKKSSPRGNGSLSQRTPLALHNVDFATSDDNGTSNSPPQRQPNKASISNQHVVVDKSIIKQVLNRRRVHKRNGSDLVNQTLAPSDDRQIQK
jgi:hypothetical protein